MRTATAFSFVDVLSVVEHTQCGEALTWRASHPDRNARFGLGFPPRPPVGREDLFSQADVAGGNLHELVVVDELD